MTIEKTSRKNKKEMKSGAMEIRSVGEGFEGERQTKN